MANRLYLPYLNPLRFKPMNPVLVPQYISKHMDDWIFEKTLSDHETPATFRQVWSLEDAIRNQFESNYEPITFKLFKCSGEEVYSQELETRQQNFFRPDFYIRQGDLDTENFPPGDYYATLTCEGTDLNMVSEPFTLSADVPMTLYVEYSHYETYGGIRFDSPFSPAIRIPGWLKYQDTSSRDTMYEDDPANEEMLQSVPYRVWDLYIGGGKGIPPYLKDIVSRILGCSTVKIDGREYTKNEGAKWEAFEEEDWPMKGYKIELRERYNRDTGVVDNDVQIPGIAAAGLIVETKGFGMDDSAGNDYLEIQSVQ